ncbi:DUF1707 SHOCT-like domain-containing protein [Nocardia callitridis]
MGGPETAASSGVDGTAVGDRDLRVSDLEREHVGQLLQKAVGLGMLSLGEFTERMDTVLAAKTRGELNAVLIDLPGIQLGGRPFGPTAPPRYTAPAVGSARSDGAIRGRFSSVQRRGPWHVPPTLRIDCWFSSVDLDFTTAIMSTQVVEIRVDATCSSVDLIVPREATVDLNGLDLVGSGAHNRVRTGPPIGPLHLVVHGRLNLSSVDVKTPFRLRWMRGARLGG